MILITLLLPANDGGHCECDLQMLQAKSSCCLSGSSSLALFPSTGASEYVRAFDSLLAGPVAEYMRISVEIGGDVRKHVSLRLPC